MLRRLARLTAVFPALAGLLAVTLSVAACQTRDIPREPSPPIVARTPTLLAAELPAASSSTTAPNGPMPEEPPLGCATLRDVVVSDVVRVQGSTLYYADASQGLLIVDVTDASQPHLVSVSPFAGTPKAVFIRDGIAWVVFIDSNSKTARDGSRTIVRGIDVRNPRAPRAIGDQVRDGTVRDVKLVGGFLYVLRGVRGHTAIESFGVRDGSIALLDTIDLDGAPAQLAASAAGLAVVTVNDKTSNVSWIDLSMERPGSLSVREAVPVPGGVATWEHGEGRIVDADEGQRVRLVTCATRGCAASEGATLRIVDFGTDAPAKNVTALQVTEHDGLPLTRFTDGVLYVTETAASGNDTTTLHVVDTEAPTPAFTAHLSLRGRLSALVPHDTSLVALGTVGSPESQVKIVLHDLDVRRPTAPRSRASVTFGSDWTWSVALHEDAAVSFDPASHLLAVPFTAWRHVDKKYVTGAQLFDLAGVQNGASFAADGFVERAVFLDGHLVTMGPNGINSIDYTSTHEPDLRERTLELEPRRSNGR
jgi:hypothetical protein